MPGPIGHLGIGKSKEVNIASRFSGVLLKCNLIKVHSDSSDYLTK